MFKVGAIFPAFRAVLYFRIDSIHLIVCKNRIKDVVISAENRMDVGNLAREICGFENDAILLFENP